MSSALEGRLVACFTKALGVPARRLLIFDYEKRPDSPCVHPTDEPTVSFAIASYSSSLFMTANLTVTALKFVNSTSEAGGWMPTSAHTVGQAALELARRLDQHIDGLSRCLCTCRGKIVIALTLNPC
jgi:hypothetical protein